MCSLNYFRRNNFVDITLRKILMIKKKNLSESCSDSMYPSLAMKTT